MSGLKKSRACTTLPLRMLLILEWSEQHALRLIRFRDLAEWVHLRH